MTYQEFYELKEAPFSNTVDEKFYYRVGAKLVKSGVLDDLDYDLFVSLCRISAVLKEAETVLITEGFVIDGGRNVQKKHPIFQIYRDLYANYLKLSNLFGLTPASRNEKFVMAELPTKKEKRIERFFKPVG